MKMSDWLRQGIEPPFGTVEHWIVDQMGRLGAEEEHSYALTAQSDGRHGVRILVAADIGLYDAFWDRSETGPEQSLSGTLHVWQEVHGLQITGLTEIGSDLRRGDPRWSLSVEAPAIEIEKAVDEAALIDFWSACRKELGRAG